MAIDPSRLLAALPTGLRDALLEEYRGIATAFAEGRWKLAGIDAGRFCEVVYSIIDGALSGKFAAAPAKPNRFPDACKALESRPAIQTGDHSIRILIPRVLPGIYDIRNNRNIGHVGGDVVPNKMDATFVRDTATWVLAELVRVFHQASVAEAQTAVDALVERRHPLVWEIEGVKRVLAPRMSAPDKTVVLLHATPGWTPVETLRAWTREGPKYRQVIRRLQDRLLVEVDEKDDRAIITPRGIEYVEKKLR
jgi:hypothetical protein